MRRAYQYRAKITKGTAAACNRWLSLCCTLYNTALEQRIDAYRRCGVSVTAAQQMKELPNLKATFPEYSAVGSQVLQDVLQRLDRTYQGFFRRLRIKSGRVGFPRFKPQSRYDSFTLKQAGWRLDGRYLYITNIGRFKMFLSRPVIGDIKTVTVRRTATGKWFVSISCDNVPERDFPETDASVGIDVGVNHFCVDSDGHSIENPRFLKQGLAILRRRNRNLARKEKGSQNRQDARLLVAKAHEMIQEQRQDFAHKVANHYIANYQNIYVEDLSIKNMVRNRHLSRSIADAAWGTFFGYLMYKAEEAGRQVIKVNPRNTSQICSVCGAVVPKTLSVRIHRCPFCGVILDRDYNASLNIKALGQRVQALTPALASVA
jgi:putative transposase